MKKSGPKTADQRAFELLCDVLLPDELRQLVEHHRLDVPSPGYPNRVYRIPRGNRGGRFVWVYENGVHIMWICLQSSVPVPDDDMVLIHRTMILGDEEDYLSRANCFSVGDITDPIIEALVRLAPPLD